jgi:hypothetical protein
LRRTEERLGVAIQTKHSEELADLCNDQLRDEKFEKGADLRFKALEEQSRSNCTLKTPQSNDDTAILLYKSR